MKRIWTQEEEAQHLAARFEGVKQAEFARTYNVPGGPSMLSQHIKGRRPMNMEAAVAYARGFGVTLAEISPRLAAQTAKATKVMAGTPEEAPGDQSGEGDVELSTSEEWRLFRAFQMLPPDEQLKALSEIETRVSHVLGRQLLEQRLGATGYATDEQVGRTIKPAPRARKGSIE